MTAPASFETADDNLAQMLDSLSGADNYLDLIVQLLDSHLQAPILEVGAGHGDLTERLAHTGPVHATDLSERCLRILSDKFQTDESITVGSLDITTPFPCADEYADGTYGSTVMVNVLEHIEDDVDALRLLAKTVTPGGTVVVFVPAFDFLYGKFDEQIGHHRRYRVASLRSTFEQAGLEPVDLRYVNLPGWFAWLLTVKLLGLQPTGGALVKMYDSLVIPIVRAIETRWRPPFGQSVIGVARVPRNG